MVQKRCLLYVTNCPFQRIEFWYVFESTVKFSDVNIVQSKERLFKVYYNIFPLEIQS